MSRAFLTVMLAALLVLTGAGAAGASPDIGGALTVSGRLEWVTQPSLPHYEVAGYVLITGTPGDLEPLVGQDVVVVGKPLTDPSIYMHKSLTVESVETLSSYTAPVKDPTKPTLPAPGPVPVPGPSVPGDGATTPVTPAPTVPAPGVLPALPQPAVPTVPEPAVPALPQPAAPQPVVPSIPKPVPADPKAPPRDRISIPAIPPADAGQTTAVPDPVPLYGTAYYVLYGRIQSGLLLRETPAGMYATPIYSGSVDLTALEGRQVGLVATREGDRYQVTTAVVLTADLGAQLQSGANPIYSLPAAPMTVKLHGTPVVLDQHPILGNSRTLVPLRAITEALGATVTWDAATGTATVSLGDREVIVTLGSSRIVIRQAGLPDQVVTCDTAPVLAGSRMLVPVRALAEAFGLKVGYDGATHTVTLD